MPTDDRPPTKTVCPRCGTTLFSPNPEIDEDALLERHWSSGNCKERRE